MVTSARQGTTVSLFLRNAVETKNSFFHNGEIVHVTGRYVVPVVHAGSAVDAPLTPQVVVEVKSSDPDVSLTRWVKVTDLGIIQNVYDHK